jgi:hypothetical protein
MQSCRQGRLGIERSLARLTELILIFVRITIDIQSTDNASSNRLESMRKLEATMIYDYAEYQKKLLHQWHAEEKETVGEDAMGLMIVL